MRLSKNNPKNLLPSNKFQSTLKNRVTPKYGTKNPLSFLQLLCMCAETMKSLKNVPSEGYLSRQWIGFYILLSPHELSNIVRTLNGNR